MSFYSLKFTVPKNTAETAPFEQKLPISPGIIHQVSVYIPPGHKGVTGCALDFGLHQIAPTNQNQWFTGNSVHYLYPEHIQIPDGTRELGLRGYNTSLNNDHTFMIAVGVLPSDVLLSLEALPELLSPILLEVQKLNSFFGAPTPTTGGP